VFAEKTQIEAARRLLLIIPRRGPGAYRVFMEILEKEYPLLAGKVSKIREGNYYDNMY
jgi:hypothetical protein